MISGQTYSRLRTATHPGPRPMRNLVAAIISVLMCGAALAQNQSVQFGSFTIDPDTPEIALLLGPIGPNAPLDFRRLIRAYPTIKTLGLASEGGDVTGALLLAQQVAQIGINTYVAKDTGCYSACSFVFFAGEDRVVRGELGVHQVSGEKNDDYATQIAVADILDALTEFGVPPVVFADMLRTPPSSMKIYTQDDAIALGINRELSALPETAVQTMPEPEPSSAPAAEPPKRAPLMQLLDSTDYAENGVNWRSEFYQLHEPAKLDDFLSAIGLIGTDYSAFEPLLEAGNKSNVLPTWSAVTVVTWAAKSADGKSDERVAAFVSLSTPEPPDGLITHRISVQMNPQGVFGEVPDPALSQVSP